MLDAPVRLATACETVSAVRNGTRGICWSVPHELNTTAEPELVFGDVSAAIYSLLCFTRDAADFTLLMQPPALPPHRDTARVLLRNYGEYEWGSNPFAVSSICLNLTDEKLRRAWEQMVRIAAWVIEVDAFGQRQISTPPNYLNYLQSEGVLDW